MELKSSIRLSSYKDNKIRVLKSEVGEGIDDVSYKTIILSGKQHRNQSQVPFPSRGSGDDVRGLFRLPWILRNSP